MASLRSKKPKDSYKELLRVDTNGAGLPTSLTTVVDGDGVGSPLQLSKTQVAINNLIWPASGAAEGKVLLVGANNQMTWGDLPAAQEVTSSAITTALGYTPYNGATNPLGFITSANLPVATTTTKGAVTLGSEISVNSDGKLTLNIASLPTFAILDAAFNTSGTYSNGTLAIQGVAFGNYYRATMAIKDRKMFFEVTLATTSGSVGLIRNDITATSYTVDSKNFGSDASTVGWNSQASTFRYKLTNLMGTVSKAAGDVFGVGYDPVTRTVEFWKNGVFMCSVVLDAGGEWYPAFFNNNNTDKATFNFGATAFAYGTPAGYVAGVRTDPTITKSFNGRTGAVTLTSSDVTTALGYTPVQSVTSSTVTTALGYTPYDATNPTGYQTAAQVKAATPYDIASSISGKPSANATVLRFVTPRGFTFPASMTGSVAKATTTATATTTFSLQKNGTQFATMAWAAGGVSAVFTAASQTSFSAGDVFTVVAPNSPDSTFGDAEFTFVASLT